MLLNIFQRIRQPHSKKLFGQNVSSTKKLRKPLRKPLFNQSQYLLHTLHEPFFAFQLHFSPFFK